jgi:putative transposase
METKYHSKNHSKFLIKLHFVFAVKYRKKLLVGKLNDDMLQIIFEICKEKGYIIDAMQSDIDHLHVLVDIEPKVSALEVAHQIKQISTFRIYKKHKEFLKKYFWKENTFFSDGYFVCSTGDASTETIQKYIEEQG